MSTRLATIIADFLTTLALEIPVGGTTTTLQSNVDQDGVTLPTGTYFFTLDGNNSQKEHFVCTLTGPNITNLKSVSRQGVQSVGALRKHRIGASVVITDFAHIKYINDLLMGVTNLDHSTPLTYDGTASITTANQLATKAYADGLAISGSPISDHITPGILLKGTVTETAAGTDVNGGGYFYAIPVGLTKLTSAGAGDAYKVPLLGSSGLLSSTFLPTVAILNGGTGQTTKQAGMDALSPLGTKGDVMVSTGTHNVAQGIGSNNQVLIADSSQTNGLKWGDLTSAGGIKKFSVSTTPVTRGVNTTSEQNLFSISIPGGVLGISGGLRGWVWLNGVGVASVNDTYTVQLKYGSTSVASIVMKPNVGSGMLALLQFVIVGAGATNAQKASMSGFDPVAAVIANQMMISGGTAAEDSTGALNLILSVQASANNDNGITLDHYIIDQF